MSQSAESTVPPRGEGQSHEHLGIAGSGTIACGLAACAAGAGVPVTVWARSDDSRDRLQEGIAKEGVDSVLVTLDSEALSQATILVEAVVEDEYVKHDVIRSLAATAADNALLASTTSSLSITALAASSGAPGRFFGLHVFNPVTRMRLVELCFPSGADPAVRSRAAAFCETLGKVAVEVPDEPGFVVNRLLFPYLFDAVRLLERTGLEAGQIDACMKLGASYPMGPLELLDFVGLDVADAIGEALFADTGEAAHRPPGRIKQLVGEGKLGKKAGAGFYRYR
jgi:3-hydroxyacyl-CoA dehydrogenase